MAGWQTLLVLLQSHLVPAAIGLIALWQPAMDGIIILASQCAGSMPESIARGDPRAGELISVLMTCVIAGVGLLPAAVVRHGRAQKRSRWS